MSIQLSYKLFEYLATMRSNQRILWYLKWIIHFAYFQAAHAIVQYQENGKQVYKAKYISLNSLCEQYNAPINPIKEQLKQIYRRDQKYWAKRPLTREMLLYAAGDVLVLINDQLYGNLTRLVYTSYCIYWIHPYSSSSSISDK